MEFSYRSYPNQIYFGAGAIRMLKEILKDHPRVFAIATPRFKPLLNKLMEEMEGHQFYLQEEVVQHVPQSLVDKVHKEADSFQPSVYLAIGGGSTIGLAKGLALADGVPIIAVPSTFSGSEQTNIYGISNEGGKTTGRDDRVLPKVVIYDTQLTQTMPKPLAVTSAMNAMAHLVEALYSPSGNPITRQLAMLGMEALKQGLESLAKEASLIKEANEQITFGAYLAGKCLCEVSMALHHKAAHVLGGSFGMEHSKVHTALQAYVLDYQWPYLSPEIQRDFKQALGNENPAKTLKDLAKNAGAAADLKSIGFQEGDIKKAAEIMVAKPYANIAPLTQEGLEGMLKRAYNGEFN